MKKETEMKKNMLLLFLACSFGSYNLHAMMEMYESEESFSDNDWNKEEEEVQPITVTPEAVLNESMAQYQNTPEPSAPTETTSTVKAGDSATVGGEVSMLDALNDPNSGVVEVVVDGEEIDNGGGAGGADGADVADEADVAWDDISLDTFNDPEQLQEIVDDAMKPAIEDDVFDSSVPQRTIWESILDFFLKISDFFSPQEMEARSEAINNAFKKSLQETQGALEKFDAQIREADKAIEDALGKVSEGVKSAFENAMASIEEAFRAQNGTSISDSDFDGWDEIDLDYSESDDNSNQDAQQEDDLSQWV